MRKMFSEKQIKGLAVSGVDEVINEVADVSTNLNELIAQVDSNTQNLGTRLYSHSISLVKENSFAISMIIISNNETIVDTPTKLGNLLSTSVSGKFANENDDEHGLILLSNFNGADLLVWYFSENDESPQDFNEDITEAVIEDVVSPL